MEMMIAVYYLRCFLLALFTDLLWLSSCLLDEVQGHSAGTQSIGLSPNPGNAYHTDSLGGNVWMFDNADDRVQHMQHRAASASTGGEPILPAFHAGHKQMTIGNKTVFL